MHQLSHADVNRELQSAFGFSPATARAAGSIAGRALRGRTHCIVYNAAAIPAFFPSLTAAVYMAQAIATGMFKLGGDRAAARLRDSEARLTNLECCISIEVK